MIIKKVESSISVVIVNHNGSQAVINCLDALEKQLAPLAQIIVVDNASTDNSPTKISQKFPQVELIQLKENVGLSIARNIGLKKAKTELVLTVDDDVYVDGGCIGHLQETLRQNSAVVVCPRIVFYHHKQIIQCDGAAPHFIGTLVLRHANQLIDHSSDAVEAQACIGACMLINRKIALASGGFDEEYFFYFEDLEFSIRMRSLGHKIVCEPKALAFHDRGQGTPLLSFRGEGEYPERRVYLNIRNRLITILMHYNIRTLLILSPALFLYEFATLLISLKRGWFHLWRNAILSVYNTRIYIRDRRKYMVENRLRNDKELLSGGNLPLSQGFISNKSESLAVKLLSSSLNFYWKLIKKFVK